MNHERFGTNAVFSEKVLNTVLITFHLLIIMTESWFILPLKTTKHEQLVKYQTMTHSTQQEHLNVLFGSLYVSDCRLCCGVVLQFLLFHVFIKRNVSLENSKRHLQQEQRRSWWQRYGKIISEISVLAAWTPRRFRDQEETKKREGGAEGGAGGENKIFLFSFSCPSFTSDVGSVRRNMSLQGTKEPVQL